MCNKSRDRGGGLIKLWHFLHKHKCIDDLELDGEWIICRKCHAKVGWIYWWNGRYLCNTCSEYHKFNRQIQEFALSKFDSLPKKKSESDQMYNDWISAMRQEIQELSDVKDDNMIEEEYQEEENG